MQAEREHTQGKMSYSDMEQKLQDLEGKMKIISHYEEVFSSIFTRLSHELRTNLNAVVAFSYLLGNNAIEDDEKKEFNKYISDSVDNLLVLFDNVLDSSLIETGKLEFYPRKIELVALFKELQREFTQILEKQNKSDLSVVLVCPANKECWAEMDETSLVRSIKNLFYNALVHTTKGKIKFGFHQDGQFVRFFMSDTGSGYRQNRHYLSRDTFAEVYKKSDDYGALALVNTKRIVELQEGSLVVEPNEPQGSVIRMILPSNRNLTLLKIKEKVLKYNNVAL